MASPDPFADSFIGLIAARAVTAAATLGVFEELAERPASAPELAERLGLAGDGAEALLTALATLGYVRLEDGRFMPDPVVERLLVGSSPESIASFVGAQSELHWDVLRPLDAAIRTGEPYRLHEDRQDDPAWEGYMRGLFEISRAEQDANAALVPLEDARSLVDVAGGHGGFAMAMCRRHPSLRATIVDLPAAASVGRRIVAEEGYAERIAFREGDVFELGLGEGHDVVSVFNLIHHLPQERNRELVRMARASLRGGGALVIGDSEKPVPGSPSEHGALSSLLFYAWSGSRNFEGREVAAWLGEAGFADVEVHRNETSPWRIVVVGSAQ
jgi:2-polyprenyl-3-methyl-5-hydroxy-6-metoxy-1,4-benzoquinol methylase